VAQSKCPACAAPGLKVTPEGNLTCTYCGITILSDANVCPACGHVNAYDVETCSVCGEPLSLLAQIMTRHDGSDQPYKLQQVRRQAPQLKESEARESDKRMEVFQAIDQRREAAEAEAKQAQEEYQRKVSTIVLLVIPVFIVFLILLVVLVR
jgi:hypothetical protein